MTIKFRGPPTSADSVVGAAPPSTWPATPAGGFTSRAVAEALVQADWHPWWEDVAPAYKTGLVNRPIGIRSIAHGMHLELRNGWSFELCLRFCEEHLVTGGNLVRASPTVAGLTTRARAFADEFIASSVTTALAASDGYHFLGDLGSYTKRFPDMVARCWRGDGPDHLLARMGTASDGFVASFLFIEAKGDYRAFSDVGTPRDFCRFKTQSLNAELRFLCVSKPILSYVYVPTDPAQPVIAQWFNAPERGDEQSEEQDRAAQAAMLLTIAFDQFKRILQRSGVAWSIAEPSASLRSAAFQAAARPGGDLAFVSADGQASILVDLRSITLFRRVDTLMQDIQSHADARENEKALLAMVGELRHLRRPRRTRPQNFVTIRGARFQILVRDPTGVEFLRRARG